MSVPRLRRLEWIIDELDTVVELLCHTIGFVLLETGRHTVLDAEFATVQAGDIELVLVSPTSTGHGEPLREQGACLVQAVFHIDEVDDYEALRHRLVTSGASVSDDGPGEMHLARSMIRDLMGESPVLTFLAQPVQDVAHP